MASGDRTTIVYPEMVNFIDSVRENDKRSYHVRWLLWVGATAVYDCDLPEPRMPGGLQVDLKDPVVMARLRIQAAHMRSCIGTVEDVERRHRAEGGEW
ncbi:hypothetical protein LCGC14_1584790 [marine sediment metagenome]|uniref:Uncharacterized protein n=1 Tax=marine sediment metagenome TaxID=412755 RepID=A0A0F9IFR6_9ZZZZ